MSVQPQEQDEQDPVAPLAARLADLKQDDPDATGSEAGGAPEPEAEPPAQQGAPAEGYDAEQGVFVKTYALAAPAPLHETPLDQLAAHPLLAGLPEAAARAALEAGHPAVGGAELVYAAADGAKTAVTYAVPTGD